MIRYVIKLTSLAGLAMATVGCTTTMSRAGTSGDQANRDIAECKYEASKSAPDNPLIAMSLAKQCLALRGYKKR